MSRYALGALTGLLLAGCFGFVAAADGEEPKDRDGWFYDGGLHYRADDERFELALTNLFQGRFTQIESEDTDESKGSFDLETFKLRLEGKVLEDWRFRFQINLADGSETSEELLEDAFVVFARRRMAQLWVGQGKTFFGRQQLTSLSELQFANRSIVSERFTPGRDVGLALLGENARGTYRYQLGVYNGEGINKDEGDNEDYMGIGRLVVMPLGPLPVSEIGAEREKRSRVAIGVAVMTNTEGTEGVEETRLTRGGFEFQFRRGGYNLSAEFFTENDDPVLAAPGTETDTDGWYLQSGYRLACGVEIAGRYSVIAPQGDDNDTEAYAGVVNWYFSKKMNHRLQLEFRDLTFDAVPVTPFIDTQIITLQLQLEL